MPKSIKKNQHSAKERHNKGPLCDKLKSTPIVLTKRLEDINLFKGNTKRFKKNINLIPKVSRNWFVKEIVKNVEEESILDIKQTSDKSLSNNHVTNFKQFERLVRKIYFLNHVSNLSRKKKEKFFKLNVLYKNTIEYYCITNKYTIKSYVSVKSDSVTRYNINNLVKCFFEETLCCWLKRNHVVEMIKISCDLEESVANFMKQFHPCRPVCQCCEDCIRIHDDERSEFPGEDIDDATDDLPLVTFKKQKNNKTYSILLSTKPDLDNITSKTPYPDVRLINMPLDESSVISKALHLKRLIHKRNLLSNVCEEILHNADVANNKITTMENYLNNTVLEIHYPDVYISEMTEIIELGPRGEILVHVRKFGNIESKNLVNVINNSKKVLKVRLCCVSEKNKAFDMLAKSNIIPTSLNYLDTLYTEHIRKKQNYSNVCNWTSKHITHSNDIVEQYEDLTDESLLFDNNLSGINYNNNTIKNVAIDEAVENNNFKTEALDKLTSTVNYLSSDFISKVSSPKISNIIIRKAFQLETANKTYSSNQNRVSTSTSCNLITDKLESLDTALNATKPIESAFGNKTCFSEQNRDSTSSNLITDTVKPQRQPVVQSNTSKSSQLNDLSLGKFSMQNIITNTIKNKFIDTEKNALIREINLLIEYLSKRFEYLSVYLDDNDRVTATVKCRNKISDDEVKVLQKIIFKTQKLVNENIISSNFILNHVLSSLPASDDNQAICVISKTFTLQQPANNLHLNKKQSTVAGVRSNQNTTAKSQNSNESHIQVTKPNDKIDLNPGHTTVSEVWSNQKRTNTTANIQNVNESNIQVTTPQYKIDLNPKNSTFAAVSSNQMNTNRTYYEYMHTKATANIEVNEFNTRGRKPKNLIGGPSNTNRTAKQSTKKPQSSHQTHENINEVDQKRKSVLQSSFPNKPLRTCSTKTVTQTEIRNSETSDAFIIPLCNDSRELSNIISTTIEEALPPLVPIKREPKLIITTIPTTTTTVTYNPPKLINSNLDNAQNDPSVLYPINAVPNMSRMSMQNPTFIPFTGANSNVLQNLLGNNQSISTNTLSHNFVVVPQAYSVPIPSSAITVQIPVLKPGENIPVIKAQPYIIVNPIERTPNPSTYSNNIGLNAAVPQFPPVVQNQNIFFCNDDVKPNVNELVQNVQPTTITDVKPDENEMSESITMWSKAPKSKKIVRTELKTVTPHVPSLKRLQDVKQEGILDFFGEVKKIRIEKTS